MALLTGDEGALVVVPQGDILFANAQSPDGRPELVLALSAKKYARGARAEGLAGRTTADMGEGLHVFLRLVLDITTCTTLLERITVAQMELLGMPRPFDMPDSAPEDDNAGA